MNPLFAVSIDPQTAAIVALAVALVVLIAVVAVVLEFSR